MEMLTLPLSIAAFGVTLWITSFFATLLSAEKAGLEWIAVSWLIAGAVTAAALFGVNILALDKYLEVAALLFIPLVTFTLTYKLVNKMNWTAAITTNVVAVAVAIIATVSTIIVLGKPLDKTLMEIASSVGLVDKVVAEDIAVSESDDEYEEEVIDPVFKETDLLSPKVATALEQQKKREEKYYKEPKFRVINIRHVNGAVGYKIRLSQNSGKVIEGSLRNVRGGELIIQRNLYGGVATIPIAMNTVKKLEVYR